MKSVRTYGLIRNYSTKTSTEVIEKSLSKFVPVYARNKIVFSHGQGCYLFDVEGKKYLDFSSGIAVNSLGHGDPDVLRAINLQAQKLIHVGNLFYNQPAATAAEKLIQTCFADKVFFCNSGTEANEGALKFARRCTKNLDPEKFELISFTGGFHGRTMGALSVTYNNKYKDPFSPLIPGVKTLPFNDIETAKKEINKKTSAVIVEPIQGEGGVNVSTIEFIHELRRMCDQTGSILIFDEIQCGMGRSGKMWCHEHYGVKPDIMTVAKALGNGFPIGAILINKRITESLSLGDHGSTFAGQPLAAKVAEAVLDKISNPDFLQHVQDVGNHLKHRLSNMKTTMVQEVRGRGLIVGVQFDVSKAGLKDATPIVEKSAQKGLILIKAGDNVIRFVPPLIISKSQVDEAIDILEASLQELENKQ